VRFILEIQEPKQSRCKGPSVRHRLSKEPGGTSMIGAPMPGASSCTTDAVGRRYARQHGQTGGDAQELFTGSLVEHEFGYLQIRLAGA